MRAIEQKHKTEHRGSNKMKVEKKFHLFQTFIIFLIHLFIFLSHLFDFIFETDNKKNWGKLSLLHVKDSGDSGQDQ